MESDWGCKAGVGTSKVLTEIGLTLYNGKITKNMLVWDSEAMWDF